MRFNHHSQAGVTLIEIAVVLFIVSLFLGALLVPFVTVVEKRQRDQTQVILEEIQTALYGFATTRGRLPCPDCKSAVCGNNATPATPNDGIEDLNGNICATPVGNVPWADLGVTKLDAWGHVFTYRVTPAFSTKQCAPPGPNPDNCGCPTSSPPSAFFALCHDGDIEIGNADGATANIASEIPAIVISHGENHYNSEQSAHEVENYDRAPTRLEDGSMILTTYENDAPTKFVYKNYDTSTSDNAFDDLVIWISPYILKNQMISVGKLP